ncbi:hypothetical protein QNN00_00615 [Bacillus velezensis]|nr:hypothetical protein [Bacillus velezensis]
MPTTAQGYITNRFGWYYLLDVSLLLLFVLFLVQSAKIS